MKDDLKEIFDGYRPEMGDSEEYMQCLQEKMAALEMVKCYAEEQRRLYRRRMVIAFTVGTVLGIGMTIYMLLHPFAVAESPTRLTWFIYNSRFLLSALTVAAVSIGIAILCTLQPLKEVYSSPVRES